ncbi:MAG: hypothetical protein EP329_04735 [Deltaproteobacteria bacterium]|nr:MAG: hypothetical protein EP329_04735 [Deltaproteobacteria bacterium]
MRPRSRALLALPLLSAATLFGCLEARSGAQHGQTDTISSDTLGTDTTVQDLCLGRSCDDGDPCTVDSCDPSSGACVYAAIDEAKKPGPAAEPPECAFDDDCDDGDACTEDRCLMVGDECFGYSWAYCENTPIVGCGGCIAETCDDGDPCTEDACGPDGQCTHTAILGCGVGCSGVNAMLPTELEWNSWPGDSVTVAGVAGPYTWASPVCYDGGGGDCAVCAYPVGLADDVYATPNVEIVPPLTFEGPVWQCADGCYTSCAPMGAGGAYWVWGTAQSSWRGTYADSEADRAIARPPTDGLMVNGWCLQTNAQGLPGDYQGEVWLEDYDQAVPYEATIELTSSGGLQMRIRPSECLAVGCPGWIHEVLGEQTVQLTPGDGTVAFDMEMITVCDAITTSVHVELASYHNTLSGSFADGWGGGAEAPPEWACSRGKLSLTRGF